MLLIGPIDTFYIQFLLVDYLKKKNKKALALGLNLGFHLHLFLQCLHIRLQMELLLFQCKLIPEYFLILIYNPINIKLNFYL